MNKTAIKNYAIWARVQLIEAAKQRAYEYEITDGGENKSGLDAIGGRLLSKTEKEQRIQLIAEINQKGFSQVMEEAAYTWFNRFIALRFMEVNGYLPSKVRVFTDENGAFKPEILKQAMSVDLEGLDRSKVLELLDKQDNEELFKYLIITQCNALNAGLPYLFEKIANWTELLFPTNLLRQDSVIGRLISDIAIEDWDNEVEIIGWFYQYYISEKHEEIVDALHGTFIKKEDIPATTQLFTTDWVVRYILDNSLGRYWIERHPDSKLADKLAFLLVPPNGIIPLVNDSIIPEELKVLDPCVGSGHFLSYAFDILIEIYRECGWSDRDAAKSIIENNLYGLDIDDRAAQLACFAVMMKARKYNRRILSTNTRLHIFAMQESALVSDELIKYVSRTDTSIRSSLNELRRLFSNAKEYGSIIETPKLDFNSIYARIDEIREAYVDNLMEMVLQQETVGLLLPLVQQAEVLSGKYDVVATNPPYFNKYSARLKSYITDKYAAYKGDLFSVFMYRNFGFCKKNGYSGFMTPNVWMFIKSYQELREFIINTKSIASLIQISKGSFYSDATVDVIAFILENNRNQNGIYIRLEDFKGDMDVQKAKVLEAIDNVDCGYYYYTNNQLFSQIPGTPIAYWVGKSFYDAFKYGKSMDSFVTPKQGLATADNEQFLRLWFEVSTDKLAIQSNVATNLRTSLKWIPYNKGGEKRRWYGNYDYVVNWENDGYGIKHNFDSNGKLRSRPQNTDTYLKEAITWNDITSGGFSIRYRAQGSIHDVTGMSAFSSNPERLKAILGLMSTKLSDYFFTVLNPTIHLQIGNFCSFPVLDFEDDKDMVAALAEECISIAKEEWDSYETSWDFCTHPLLRYDTPEISKAFDLWNADSAQRFYKLKDNEENLNRYFIALYHLCDELSPDLRDDQITLKKADLPREIKSLISYAVGCMFGRYSVDVEGLCYAGGEWDASKYKAIIPDSDNIIPICDDDYFDDDIVGKFVDFIRVAYGEKTLEQNLRFIADVLGGKGTSREVIRSYFINEFYTDHCNTYSVTGSGKRPIYWLFSSGKKNGFKALIYMHRYQPDLLARMRTDYVHEQQERYRTQLQMLEIGAQSAAPSERVKLNKQIAKLKDQALEIQKYEEKIHHLADQMISIDLDDGVKVNYAKFQDVLEKIK